MTPFEAIGDKPRWALALEVLRKHTTDEVVGYDELHAALGVDNRTIVQAATRDAGKRLLEEDSKALEAVPNEGYRIVKADEQVRLAKSQQKRSRRALVKGQALSTHVDYSELSPEGRRLAEATAYGFGRVLDAMRETDRRVARMAKAQEALEKRVEEGLEDNSERLARLEEQLAALRGSSDT